MKILAIDSSSITASVAVIENETIVSEFFINAGLTHSQTLAPMVQSALEFSGRKTSDMDLIAVTNGPGSFTGLRIGMACAKAMALVENKPCVGVSSLYALAYNLKNKDALICACMDARRETVYNAIFEAKNGKLKRLIEDRSIAINDLCSKLLKFNSDIYFVGDGASECYRYIENNCNYNNVHIVPVSEQYIKASSIAFTAQEIYKNNISTDDACSIGLNYLKVSQAERLLSEGKLKSQVIK